MQMEKEKRAQRSLKKEKWDKRVIFLSERVWGKTERRSGEEVGSCRERRKYLTLFSFPFGPLGFSESSLSPE